MHIHGLRRDPALRGPVLPALTGRPTTSTAAILQGHQISSRQPIREVLYVSRLTSHLSVAAIRSSRTHTKPLLQEAIHQRSFSAERITALTTAPSGGYIAAGGSSGTLYIWATSSGRLLLSHKAHFQAVTCLRFTDHQAHFLFSGGRDSIINCWEVMKLLDASAVPNSVQPRWSKCGLYNHDMMPSMHDAIHACP